MMFQFICDLTIRATLLLMAAAFVCLALRKSSAAVRHRLWALTMIGLLVLPLLPLFTPAIWSVTVPPDVAGFIPSNIVSPPLLPSVPNDSRFATAPLTTENPQRTILYEAADVASIKQPEPSMLVVDPHRTSSTIGNAVARYVPLIWAGGIFLMLLNLALGTARALQIKVASIPITDSAWQRLADELRERLGLKTTVELREHPGDLVPLTLGVMRPVVVLPRQARNWTDRLKRTVLLHELAHVQRRDVAYQWPGRLACTLYWFHPLAWWGLHKLRQERERACDDLVVHCGERASEYAEDLVVVARSFQHQRNLVCAVAMARHGDLEGRMRSLFDADVVRSHAAPGKLFALAILLLVALTTAGVSAVQLAAQSAVNSNADTATLTDTPAAIPGVPVLYPGPADDDEFHDDEYDLNGNPRDRKPGPLEHTVTVINDDGKPVVGAKIIPQGFGTNNGAGWGWLNDFWPKEFATDEKGIARILVPEDKLAILPAESGSIRSVSFRIEHPEFATTSKSMVYLRNTTPIKLRRGIVLAPRAIDSATNQPLTSDLFALSSGYPAPSWAFRDGQLLSAPIDTSDSETGKYFRLIHAPTAPSNSPVRFSGVIDATRIPVIDQLARIDVPLFPGVRLSGKLSADVPRPLKKGGHIVASIRSGDLDLAGYPRQTVGWGDVAMLDEDGNFEFPYLPRQSHVELIAVCDGWVSKAKSEDLAAYDRIHQTQFQKLNTDSSVASTPVYIDHENVSITLDMVQMGSCEFLVEDENGMPLDLATIHCMPNHQTYGGGTILGSGGRSLDYLRNPQLQTQGESNRSLSQYVRTTGPDGRAVISNLPASPQMFQVLYPGYKMPQDPQFGGSFRMGVADVKSGTTSKVTVRMEPAPEFGQSLPGGSPEFDRLLRIPLSFVDAEGAPVSGVRVILRGQTILRADERQPWPAEWHYEVTPDEAYRTTIQMQLPTNLSPGDGRKIRIWFDAECPGFVPLTDHEFSLAMQLPIRMQAR